MIRIHFDSWCFTGSGWRATAFSGWLCFRICSKPRGDARVQRAMAVLQKCSGGATNSRILCHTSSTFAWMFLAARQPLLQTSVNPRRQPQPQTMSTTIVKQHRLRTPAVAATPNPPKCRELVCASLGVSMGNWQCPNHAKRPVCQIWLSPKVPKSETQIEGPCGDGAPKVE